MQVGSLELAANHHSPLTKQLNKKQNDKKMEEIKNKRKIEQSL